MILASLLLLFQFHANCSAPVDPTLIPLPSCTSYQGYPGGLYVGTNTRPTALNTKALAAISQIVPRDAGGTPDPNGSIVVLTIGQSYSFAVANFCAQYAEADPLKSPHVHFICAASGAGADVLVDPNHAYWSQVAGVVAASPYTPAQIQVLWLMTTHLGLASDPYVPPLWGPFPLHAQTLETDILTIVDNLPFIPAINLSNISAVYLSARMTGRYGDPTSPLLPVPTDYEGGFGNQWAIAHQQGTYIDWGPYWYDQNDPCSYFGADGTHLSPAGAAIYGEVLHTDFRDDRLKKRFYR